MLKKGNLKAEALDGLPIMGTIISHNTLRQAKSYPQPTS